MEVGGVRGAEGKGLSQGHDQGRAFLQVEAKA